MKVGDLVRLVDEEDDDVGAVIDVKPYVEGSRGYYQVCVYWGPNPQFGKQFEWDWDYDLKVVEESWRLKGDTDRVPDGASGPYVIRPVPIEEARGECELSFPAKAVSSWGSREPRHFLRRR